MPCQKLHLAGGGGGGGGDTLLVIRVDMYLSSTCVCKHNCVNQAAV